jgi:hypothetical protein
MVEFVSVRLAKWRSTPTGRWVTGRRGRGIVLMVLLLMLNDDSA